MEENVSLVELKNYLLNMNSSIDYMSNAVSNVSRRMDTVSARVDRMDSQLSTTHAVVVALMDAFSAYVEFAHRTANVQRAETKLGNLKSDIDRKYGHYDKVRRTSIGVLQAFDVANVSTAVVSHVSEELMIQSPNYWLAPALVAIAAWGRDDKDIVDKSVEEAFRRNAQKTSLFFALVLRRLRRFDTALCWLQHYLHRCDANALTREFAVILESLAQGAFGSNGATMLATQLNTWTKKLRRDNTIVETQVSEWVEEFRNNSLILSPNECPELRNCCSEFDKLKNMLEAASALGRVKDKYQLVYDDENLTPQASVDMLDGLLERLVTEYDEEELPLRREVAYNEAIIEADGDMERAKEKANSYERALEETIDAVSLQTQIALSPNLMGVSVQTQKLAVGLSSKDFLAALKIYTDTYRSEAVDSVHIVLTENHSQLAKAYNFSGYEGEADDDEEDAFSALHEAWDNTFAKHINSLRFKNKQLLKPILYSVIAVMILFIIYHTAAYVAAPCCAAGIALWAHFKKKKADKAIKKVVNRKTEAFEESKRYLTTVRTQFENMQKLYRSLDSDEEDLKNLIIAWPNAILKNKSLQEGEK